MIAYAAIRYPSGEIVRAKRHYIIIRHMAARGIRTGDDCVHGFTTDTGEFVDRTEAARIARRTDQVHRTGHKGPLYSEDVWPDHEADKEGVA